ncbi:Uncharacterised protein [Klebsiella pneumoniae]|nr:Uncharacterised protein [Klebsiella pneumoniae]
MISLGAQQVNRPDAYLQMLGDSALVKAVSLAGKLDFTVQRLVRDAEQRAVGDAEAIALGGDGRALHIDSYRPAEIKAQRRSGIAQLPVTVVGGDHRPGTQPLLNLFAGHPAHLLGGVVEGALHFGNAGDRNIWRQHRIQYMIVTQIGVGQHIVADGLAFAQAAAVADH